MSHLRPGTRILTTDKSRTKLIPGEIIGPHTKPSGGISSEYYKVKLEDGSIEILQAANKAAPGKFEVVQHENAIKTSPTLKENYERLFGKMTSFDKLGIKK